MNVIIDDKKYQIHDVQYPHGDTIEKANGYELDYVIDYTLEGGHLLTYTPKINSYLLLEFDNELKDLKEIEIKKVAFETFDTHKIMLHNLKYFSMRRGLAYNCDVYFEGEKIGMIENEGNGGGTWFYPFDRSTLSKDVQEYLESEINLEKLIDLHEGVKK